MHWRSRGLSAPTPARGRGCGTVGRPRAARSSMRKLPILDTLSRWWRRGESNSRPYRAFHGVYVRVRGSRLSGGPRRAARQGASPRHRVFPPQSSPVLSFPPSENPGGGGERRSLGGTGVPATYAARETAARAPKSTLTMCMSSACKVFGTLITGPERHPRHATCVRSRQVENLFAPFRADHPTAFAAGGQPRRAWYGDGDSNPDSQP